MKTSANLELGRLSLTLTRDCYGLSSRRVNNGSGLFDFIVEKH